ncbi:MAG: hypothetical protein HUU20_18600 [Pirellulales bacterium]|nr:hypothetical protein [Pirellulales bacterium]
MDELMLAEGRYEPKLLRAVTSIHEDRFVSVRFPVLSIAWLHRVNRICNRRGHPLHWFLMGIIDGDLVETVLHVVLPPAATSIRDRLHQLWDEQREASGNHEFLRAAALRDEIVSLREELRNLCPEPIEIQPEHVMEAIRRLGYAGGFE